MFDTTNGECSYFITNSISSLHQACASLSLVTSNLYSPFSIKNISASKCAPPISLAKVDFPAPGKPRSKNKDFIFNACIRNHIDFKNHTSNDRISNEELSDIFNNISNHLVIAVKGFYRRANLIPNEWKKKIGATHERYVKKYDTNVQVQGLSGRMSGYWKQEILGGHKTGPHRTSIDAIKEYEEFYKNPLGKIKYSTTCSKKIFLNPKHIQNLEIINKVEVKVDQNKYRVYDNELVVKNVCELLGYEYRVIKNNLDGFKETSLNRKKEVASFKDAISKVHTAYGTNNGETTWRTYYPCYIDTTNNETLRFVVIIRPTTDINMVKNEIDRIYPSIQI